MRHRTRLTIIQKIALGYLLTALFGLTATFYAISSLRSQAEQASELIHGDYRALMMATALRRDLLAFDRLEKAGALITDKKLDAVHQKRRQDFLLNWNHLRQLPLSQSLPTGLDSAGQEYTTELEKSLLTTGTAQPGAPQLSALRDELLKQFDLFLQSRVKIIDGSLSGLTTASQAAYRMTLLTTLLGISLGVAVAFSVIAAIRSQTRNLINATSRISNGEYDYIIDTDRNDEFGELAQAFMSMNQQLQQLEQLRLDANPLTHLPGNMAIDHEINRRIEQGESFAHIYIDIDNFKSFNDRYGYQQGDRAIALVRDILKQILSEIGSTDHLLGHIGGDDFVVLCAPENCEILAQRLIKAFDEQAPLLYNAADRAVGYITGYDRQDRAVQYPLMTLSVAIVTAGSLSQPSPAAISRECAKIKHHLKKMPGSNSLIDRRELR